MSFQSYLDNVRSKNGKSPEDFERVAADTGLTQPLAKATVITDRLKADFGLGHGHAMAVYAWLKGKRD